MTTDPIAGFRPAADERLATGWDADTPHGDTVVHDYLTTLQDRLTGTAAAIDGRVRAVDDGVLVDCRSAYVFDNIAICAGPMDGSTINRVAGRAAEFFDGSHGWSLLCLHHRVDLRAHGLELIGHPPLMYRPRGGTPPPAPDELEICAVDDLDRLRDFESVLVEAYPLPGGSSVVDRRLLGGGLRAWVGYVDGEPVATAGSHTTGALTEIEWVATLRSARGLGIGTQMTWTALSASPHADAALIATDDGRPVYRRLGFAPLLRFTMWMHP